MYQDLHYQDVHYHVDTWTAIEKRSQQIRVNVERLGN